jgi:hypothetical protein
MVLKINKDYFKNLANGKYSLKVRFSDGHAEGTFEVKNKISFTILGITFTATAGMTWADWIKSFAIGASGNGIIWISLANQLYIDTRYNSNWSLGASIGSEEDALYDSNDVRQTLNTPIINGASYGRSSNAPSPC